MDKWLEKNPKIAKAKRPRTKARWLIIEEWIKEDAKSMERGFFGIEMGCQVFIHGRYAYIIPCGEDWLLKGFELPEFAEDFSYWNNSDRPDELSDREWNRRGRTWDKIIGTGRDEARRRLIYDVISIPKGREFSHSYFELKERVLGTWRRVIETDMEKI